MSTSYNHKHKWQSIGTWHEGTPQGEFHVEGYTCDCGKRKERREQVINIGVAE